MSDLKKAWQQTAKSFIIALNDLGESLIDTAKAGRELAVEWAKKDNPHVQAEGHEVSEEEPRHPTEDEAAK